MWGGGHTVIHTPTEQRVGSQLHCSCVFMPSQSGQHWLCCWTCCRFEPAAAMASLSQKVLLRIIQTQVVTWSSRSRVARKRFSCWLHTTFTWKATSFCTELLCGAEPVAQWLMIGCLLVWHHSPQQGFLGAVTFFIPDVDVNMVICVNNPGAVQLLSLSSWFKWCKMMWCWVREWLSD